VGERYLSEGRRGWGRKGGGGRRHGEGGKVKRQWVAHN